MTFTNGNYQGKPCLKCGNNIEVYSRSGLCRECYHKRRRATRSCSRCEKSISPYSTTGLCVDCRLATKRKDPDKYHIIRINGKGVAEHRYVWEKAHGKPIPKGWVIHHLNGRKGDNRPVNLLAMPKHRHNGHLLEKALQDRIKELEQEVKHLKAAVL